VKNLLHGLKQTYALPNSFLSLVFSQSKIDPCIFYQNMCVLLIYYCNDTLMMGPSPEELNDIFKLLNKTFTVSDKGSISNYLGIKVNTLPHGQMRFTQEPQLINSIITDYASCKAKNYSCTFNSYMTKMVNHGQT
jgi:hypothetical protein